MMEYGELYLPPVSKPQHNAKNGRFLKGHIPFNKGKKWSEYMGKRAQKRAAKGWVNVTVHRAKHRPDTAGRCRKPCVAVMKNGEYKYFEYLGEAAKYIGVLRESIGRCCRENAKHGKNTDHSYYGIRWYFFDDDWTNKIKQNG